MTEMARIPVSRAAGVADLTFEIRPDHQYFQLGAHGRPVIKFDHDASIAVMRSRLAYIDDPLERTYVLVKVNWPTKIAERRDSLFLTRSYETALRIALREGVAIYDPKRTSLWRPAWPSRYRPEARTITNMRREEFDCYLTHLGDLQVPPDLDLARYDNILYFKHGRRQCEH